MIALYSETSDTRDHILHLLGHSDLESTLDRDAFQEMLDRARVAITELGGISDADVAWLERAVPLGLDGPPCIVVAPFALKCFQRLREIESRRVHVVWTEEVGQQLRLTVDRIDPWSQDPIQHLGRRLIRDYSLHQSLVEGIRHICRLPGGARSDPPTGSVTELVRRVRVAPDAFRRYWRGQMPLRCRPKELIAWGLLWWAIRRREHARWAEIADQVGVRRRTLERSSMRLAGCTLATAAREPMRVRQRFDEWVKRVSVAD